MFWTMGAYIAEIVMSCTAGSAASIYTSLIPCFGTSTIIWCTIVIDAHVLVFFNCWMWCANNSGQRESNQRRLKQRGLWLGCWQYIRGVRWLQRCNSGQCTWYDTFLYRNSEKWGINITVRYSKSRLYHRQSGLLGTISSTPWFWQCNWIDPTCFIIPDNEMRRSMCSALIDTTISTR